MQITRILTRLPGGLVRCVIGLAAAAFTVIGLAAGKKRRLAPRDADRGKSGGKEGP